MAAPMEFTANNWKEARDYLRKAREENIRDSERALEAGEIILNHHPGKVGEETLDSGRHDIAQCCVNALNIKFPGSLRVQVLQGKRLEAVERFEAAEEIYREILEEDPTNSIARKRVVAILKQQDRIAEAIKELNDYLKKFMSDHEGWMELSELYLSELEYAKAAFCLEELVMSNPHNHLYYQKYAEVKYTMGGTENMEQARKYFAAATKLNPNNMRALYGFFLAASNLSAMPSKGSTGKSLSKKENTKYATWAAGKLCEKYQTLTNRNKASSQQQMKMLTDMIDAISIQSS